MTFIITCQFLFPSHLYKTGNLSLINKCYRLAGKNQFVSSLLILLWLPVRLCLKKCFLSLRVRNAKMFYTVFKSHQKSALFNTSVFSTCVLINMFQHLSWGIFFLTIISFILFCHTINYDLKINTLQAVSLF